MLILVHTLIDVNFIDVPVEAVDTDASWLAYVLYGEPRAKITLGKVCKYIVLIHVKINYFNSVMVLRAVGFDVFKDNRPGWP